MKTKCKALSCLRKTAAKLLKGRAILAFALALAIITSVMSVIGVNASTEIRHCTNSDGDVFLGGTYMEIGVSEYGSFGTKSGAPASYGFHGNRTSNGSITSATGAIGLISDSDGWDQGTEPETGDFFLPGSKEERWILNYKIEDTTRTLIGADRMSRTTTELFKSASTVDTSSGNELSATTTIVSIDDVKLTIVVRFKSDAVYYTTDVYVENLSGKEITDVRFCRSFDPDQDVWKYGTYETYNKVISNPDPSKQGGEDNAALVIARGYKSLAGMFFMSVDNRTRASAGVSFSPTDAYMSGLWDTAPTPANKPTEEALEMSTDDLNGYTSKDTAIAITTNFGNIESGKSDKTMHMSSLDSDVIGSFNKIKADLGLVTSTTQTVKIEGLDNEHMYRVIEDGTGTSSGWFAADSEGKIIFEGLTPNTKYIIQAVHFDDYNEGNPDPEDIEELDTKLTQIDTNNTGIDKEGVPAQITAVAEYDSLTFSNLNNDDYTYDLYLGNNVVASGVQNEVKIDGLNPDTEYTIIARTEYNVGAKVMFKTLIRTDIIFNNNGGVGNMETITVGGSVNVTLSLNTFTKDKYLFSHWKAEDGTLYNDGIL